VVENPDVPMGPPPGAGPGTNGDTVGAEHAGTIMTAANTRATARMLFITISLVRAKKAESITRSSQES
jgi:hypothetical protein